jgi:hypothetical protein
VPSRVEGRIRFQDRLYLGKGQPNKGSWYPWPSAARRRYLRDLARMPPVGGREYAPFGWPDGSADRNAGSPLLFLPDYMQEIWLVNFLNQQMYVPTEDMFRETMADWEHPGELATYRLYPGGKVYQVHTLYTGWLEQTTLKPDPKSNPLGLYYRDGGIELWDKVTIQGTLVTKGQSGADVDLRGKNVQLVSHDLPALQVDGLPEVPVRLPLVVANEDIHVYGDAECSLIGILAAWDDFTVWPRLEPTASLSGTAQVDQTATSATDTSCRISNVALSNSAAWFNPPIDSRVVPAGARFTVSTPGNDTEYTVTGRTPINHDQPTTSIEFWPPWGNAVPGPGDVISLMPSAYDLTMLSRIICKEFSLGGRMDWWELAGENVFALHAWWEDRYVEFEDQLGEDDAIDSFPVWLRQNWGVHPQPPVVITPDPTPARYHWRDLGDPSDPYNALYVPGEDDEGGLRWDLVRWTELGDPEEED